MPLSNDNLGQVAHALCHKTVKFGIGHGAVVPYSWEGNRRSGIALAKFLRLIHLRSHSLRKGGEHFPPPNLLSPTLLMGCGDGCPFFLLMLYKLLGLTA